MNKLPKLKYPSVYTEHPQKENQKTRQLLALLMNMDNTTFEKIWPKTKKSHEN